MGIFHSKLSNTQTEILRLSPGLKVEDVRPLLENIQIFVFQDNCTFHKHNIPNSIAFLVMLGEYIVNTKSTFGGGKPKYYL